MRKALEIVGELALCTAAALAARLFLILMERT